MAESGKQVFTPEQVAWLEKRLNASPAANERLARMETNLGWIKLIGGAMVAGLVWLGTQAYDTNGRLDRMEAILEERLPPRTD
ncbi:MAG: hypothetical protein F4X97_13285 [Boseongicola sp. SB0662_bin_57]|nr:hypothetical protein [Rhodospirillaceae bacterium]MYA89398.1 hypothetical protein [Boseongicola sp. SB0662_bin_57]